MCGIAGFLTDGSLTGERVAEIATAMSMRLAHRGPDDSGLWVDERVGVALAHRRLSIIDLTPQGHQPMVSHSGRYVIVYNGEIYNYGDIRDTLERSGRAPCWRGRSDTEVVLAALEAWGLEETLRHLNGMFAFAVWDREERRLVLSRDRFGEKPLYYGFVGRSLVFASELKAFTAFPGWDPQIDRGALELYMQLNHVPGPHSIYRGIHKLRPGTFVTAQWHADNSWHLGEPTVYWSALEVASAARQRVVEDERTAVAELEELLTKAIMMRTVSDVPLGAFLSGGIDSTTVVAIMQAHLGRPVQTFTIGYEDALFNEAEYAKAVGRHLGTEHVEHYVSPQEALEVIPQLPRIYDEPFADASQIPTYLVSALARRHVTVVMSGDGGDELFGGYNRYFIGQLTWRRMRYLPVAVRRLLSGLFAAIPPARWDSLLLRARKALPIRSLQAFSGDRMHKLARALLAAEPRSMYAELISLFNDDTVIIDRKDRLPSPFERIQNWPGEWNEAESMMFLDTISVLCDDFLVKVDRAAMAVSLETRAPLLDPAVFEFAWRLPLHLRISKSQGKIALRQVLYKYVPRALIDRPKQGFGVPISKWLRGPLRDWAENLLDPVRLRQQGLLRVEPVRTKWQQHLNGTHDRQYYLWNVLMFQEWLDYMADLTCQRSDSLPSPVELQTEGATGPRAASLATQAGSAGAR